MSPPAAGVARAPRRVLPGFSLTLGTTIFWLSIVVLVPLAALVAKSSEVGLHGLRLALTDPRALAAYRLSFGASFIAALINAPFGAVVAWVLVRYRFPGKALIDALVDLPFALPTAVAGITSTSIYAEHGVLGRHLAHWGIKVAFAPAGVVVAMIFVGLPFVVRTVEPVIAEIDFEAEEAAASLGASRLTVLRRVVFPALVPALLTGFALAFARGLGEYGSVIFISGNMPMRTEIAPLLIVTRLEQYDYAGATAIAVVMLAVALLMLVAVGSLQTWSRRRLGGVR